MAGDTSSETPASGSSTSSTGTAGSDRRYDWRCCEPSHCCEPRHHSGPPYWDPYCGPPRVPHITGGIIIIAASSSLADAAIQAVSSSRQCYNSRRRPRDLAGDGGREWLTPRAIRERTIVATTLATTPAPHILTIVILARLPGPIAILASRPLARRRGPVAIRAIPASRNTGAKAFERSRIRSTSSTSERRSIRPRPSNLNHSMTTSMKRETLSTRTG